MDVEGLQRLVADFAARREWERFHTPKNLVMAMTGEMGELSELFQWLTAEESSAICQNDHRRERVEEEVADIFIYLLRLADVLDIDLAAAVEAKVEKNEQRYPAEAVKGRAVKYTEIDLL
ncbi:nucleotide pyrophosphohydrolase [Nocardia acidivorans]|uniref:nucleotide pyrophosphohydrolase n=1 Tax=Nocardia acidivorans TaxID=404580 RepID=UPI0008359E19|nr:nucleotide pyrophosphohydrolase [Nocardia acidivorans]